MTIRGAVPLGLAAYLALAGTAAAQGRDTAAGRLRYSDLVMYDRQTGFTRDYGRNPYVRYD
ncbi:MAG: DUF3179 domain-containing protein, partial [Gemmatimonadetes bacterium]|nr:DUF3179 domain-containing protein [Gemmatimonadota bacterium]